MNIEKNFGVQLILENIFSGELTSISFALANSMNNITASIIKKGP